MWNRVAVAWLAMASTSITACADERTARPRPAAPPPTTPAVDVPASSPDTSQPATDAVPNPSASVHLRDYAIQPAVLRAVAGAVTIEATNDDGVPHDTTLLRTALASDALPTTGIRVDETNPSIEILGRTPRLDRSDKATLTVSLEPGTYVLVCTIPHHYVREAMVATLTVTR